MFCPKCGREISDDADYCAYCGNEIRQNLNNNANNAPKEGQSKAVQGFLLAFFLGVIGLIIGICLYSEGTVERKTFLKAWLITFFVSLAVYVVLTLALIPVMMNAYSAY